MKRRFLSLLLLITVLAAAMIFTACDKDPAPTPTPSPAPTPTKYTVTFNVDGQTEAFSVESGKTVSEPAAPSKDGYSFLGWYTAENSKFDFSTAISADITLFAKWDQIEFTATFKADGKTVGEVAFSSLSTSIENVPAVPEKNGYTGAWEAYTLGEGNITVNAVYTPIEYTATFKAGGSEVGSVKFTVETDTVTAPAVPEVNGYTGAWEAYTLGAGNITVNAVYTPIEYTIVYHNNADGVTNTNKTSYTVESDTFTIGDLEMDNYVFLGWFTDADLTVPANLTVNKGSTGNITLYAKWNITEYTATFVADGKVVDTVKFTALTSTLAAPEVPAKNGYSGTWEPYTLAAEDITVNAIYTIIEYTATFKADGKVVGTVTFNVNTSTITAPNVPEKNGYNGSWPLYSLGAGNITVNAKYSLITYTITYINAVSGVSNPNKTTYTIESETFTISGLSKERHEFLGWYTDANFTTPADTTIENGSTANITLYAKWKCVHNYTSNVKSVAGILTDGITEYTCGRCSDSYTVTIPATKSIKILAIGNSFSIDAMDHLYGILHDMGVENIVLGNLYIGGCSLDTHYNNITSDSAAYDLYLSDSSTQAMVKDSSGKKTIAYAFSLQDWDIVTIQQASGSSGKPNTYTHLQSILDYIKANEPGAKIYWHMTWAYAPGYSGLNSYGNNQMTMYNAIVDTVNQNIVNNPDISGILPSGTAIQNLRTSKLGVDMTRDGFHLSYGTGRYTSALTWALYLTGKNVSSVSLSPNTWITEITANMDIIKEAESNAVNKTITTTDSIYPPENSGENDGGNSGSSGNNSGNVNVPFNSTLSELTESDKQYLISLGLDPDGYKLLDLTIHENYHYNSLGSSNLTLGDPATNKLQGRFLATQIFSRNELIVGSIIRIDSGYQYRPEGWVDLGQSNTTRPGNVTTEHVTVTESWWGSYNYRGFNISRTNFGQITAADAVAFRIYVPVAKTDELTQADKDYLTSLGLNPNEYRVLAAKHFYNEYYNSQSSSSHGNANAANNNKFICLELLSRYDLTKGSVITIKSGFQYRPEVWYDLDNKTTAQTRPANVTTPSVTVTDEWWGNNSYCGINISKTPSAVLEESDVDALRIYVKIS